MSRIRRSVRGGILTESLRRNKLGTGKGLGAKADTWVHGAKDSTNIQLEVVQYNSGRCSEK